MGDKFPRGSEWRRWDLHVHTPGTQKNDNFPGSSLDEKWNQFYTSIADYVGSGDDPTRSIAVIGITDYLSLDNYHKVKNDNRLPACVELIVPNIEARMLPASGKAPINIHFIFDPAYAAKIPSSFLERLACNKHNQPFSASKEGITRLGKKHAEVNGEIGDFYQIGLEQFVLEYSDIKKVLDADPELREHILIAIPNSSSDGLSALGNGSQLEATRQTYYQLCSFIFSGNPNDRAYFLGEVENIPAEKIIQKYGKLLPCLHGCDAHSNDKLFSPDMNRFCWIKADPTFEGLKQVIYEPKDRVRIQSTQPDTKPDYLVIDKVEISGDDNFSDKPILFNDKLTCIIGGKSTGKSLLLHNMASAIDQFQVDKKVNKVITKVKPTPSMTVFWKDGHQSSMLSHKNNNEEYRKIVYIPQTYLNRLSDEKEETTEIDAIIQDIVLQDIESKELFKRKNELIDLKKQELPKKILSAITTLNLINELDKQKHEKGDEKSIQHEICKLEAQLVETTKLVNVSEQDLVKYKTSSELMQSIIRTIKDLDTSRSYLNSLNTIIESISVNQDHIQVFREDLVRAVESTINTANEHWKTEKEVIISKIAASREQYLADLAKHTKIVAELKNQIEGNEHLTQLSNLINLEKRKLAEVIDLNEKIEIQKKSYAALVVSISKSFDEIKQIYVEFADAVNARLSERALEDLIFRLDVVFRAEQFKNKLADILNIRTFTHFSNRDVLGRVFKLKLMRSGSCMS